MPGIEIAWSDDAAGIAITLLVLAVVFGLVNTSIGRIARLVSIPLNILTLGLFSVVLNAALLLAVAFVVDLVWEPLIVIGGFPPDLGLAGPGRGSQRSPRHQRRLDGPGHPHPAALRFPEMPDTRPLRQLVSSGSPYEAPIGFSRAVRVGDHVVVAGTAPVWPDGHVDPNVERQAERCLEIMLAALREAGAEAGDVIRTRSYLVAAGDWEAVGRAHGRAFGSVRPASTMVVVASLLDPRWKVRWKPRPSSAALRGRAPRGSRARRVKRHIIDLDAPDRFVAGTADETDDEEELYLQAVRGPRVVTVALERQQVAQLAHRMLLICGELERRGLLAIEVAPAHPGRTSTPLVGAARRKSSASVRSPSAGTTTAPASSWRPSPWSSTPAPARARWLPDAEPDDDDISDDDPLGPDLLRVRLTPLMALRFARQAARIAS